MAAWLVVLLCAIAGGHAVAADAGHDFTYRDVAQPGGLDIYAHWDSAAGVLTFKAVSFPEPAIEIRALTPADTRKVGEVMALRLDHIAPLIAALPDQKDLPSDRVGVWDGARCELSCPMDGQEVTRTYDNPGWHDRLMDLACVGLVTRIRDLAKEAFAEKAAAPAAFADGHAAPAKSDVAHAADGVERARIFVGPAFSNVALSAPTNAAVMAFLRSAGNSIFGEVMVGATNPGCCFAISLFRPAPSSEGYVFIHQGGGDLLIASSEAQIVRALADIAARGVHEGGELRFPVGVMDGYR